MPITFPNPLAAVSMIQQPDIAGSMEKGETLKAARLGTLIEQQKLQAAQQAQAKANALQQVYQSNAPALFGADEGARQNALGQIAQYDPEAAFTLQDKIATAKRVQFTDQKAKLDYLDQTLGAIQDAPPEKQAAMYGQTVQQARAMGIDTSNVPQTYDPDWVKAKHSEVLTAKDRLDQQDKTRDFTEKQREFGITSGNTAATIAETKRHNLADEATNAKKASTMENALLPDEVLSTMADQYLAGDKSVTSNLGRGQQGSANIVKLRGKIAQRAAERGMSGADIAQAMAEFSGLTAGERTLGNRTATVGMAVNEAQQVAPLALQASEAVSRSKFVPITQAEQMVQRGTNDPDLRKFVAANNALINVYARAINPTGVPTDSDKNHAREMLSTAFDQASYKAVVGQMMQEMQAAQRAPAAVRQEFRDQTDRRAPNAATPNAAAPAGAGGWKIERVGGQ